MVPRDPWVVNGQQFKPKTTNDMSAFARVWFHLLAHYDMKFTDILPRDDQQKEFLKLVLSLRVDQEPTMVNIAKQMIGYAGQHL
jgi:hypothetical protein